MAQSTRRVQDYGMLCKGFEPSYCTTHATTVRRRVIHYTIPSSVEVKQQVMLFSDNYYYFIPHTYTLPYYAHIKMTLRVARMCEEYNNFH